MIMSDNAIRSVATTVKRRSLMALLSLGSVGSLAAEVVQSPAPSIQSRGGIVQSASSDPVVPVVAQQEITPAAPTLQAPTVQPPVVAPLVEPAPVQDEPVQPPQLNVDPNANIQDLIPPVQTPPPPAPPAPPQPNTRRRGLGATAAGFSAAPNMIGDLFGGSFSTFGGFQTISFSQHAPATLLSATPPGAANGLLVFEFGGDSIPNDVFTTGLGSDVSGDSIADTFSILEPIPPNGALTSPGPGFVFDGGTATFTSSPGFNTAQDGAYDDGSIFLVAYSYTASLQNGATGGGRPIPGPGVAARRVKLSENFSPAVRDRCFFSYNFFNDAFGGLGDVSRYTLGAERQIVERLISVEARLVTAGTYGSRQDLEQRADRGFELGNAALIGKVVLLRTDRLLWSGGLGVTLPTADDTRIYRGAQELLRVKNETVHLLPFSAVLLQYSRDTSFQAYMQLDAAVNGDPVFGDLQGGPLPRLGVFNDSTLMNLDVAMSRVVFRNPGQSALRQIIANAELHYTGTLQPSDFVTDGTLTYTNLKRNFNVVNATGGLHFVLNNNLVVTPAMSIPLRDGLDEQFDYEAIVQVNWLR